MYSFQMDATSRAQGGADRGLSTSSPALLNIPKSPKLGQRSANLTIGSPQFPSGGPHFKADPIDFVFGPASQGGVSQQSFSFGAPPPFSSPSPQPQAPVLFGPAASPSPPAPNPQAQTQINLANIGNAALYQLVMLLQQQQAIQVMNPNFGPGMVPPYPFMPPTAVLPTPPVNPSPPVPPAFVEQPPMLNFVPTLTLPPPTPTPSVTSPTEHPFTPSSPSASMDAPSPMQASPTPFDYVVDVTECPTKRPKRSKRPSDEVSMRTVVAHNRPRDSTGKFLPRKMQKTELKDIEQRLAETEQMCEQLKLDLKARTDELDDLKLKYEQQILLNQQQAQQILKLEQAKSLDPQRQELEFMLQPPMISMEELFDPNAPIPPPYPTAAMRTAYRSAYRSAQPLRESSPPPTSSEAQSGDNMAVDSPSTPTPALTPEQQYHQSRYHQQRLILEQYINNLLSRQTGSVPGPAQPLTQEQQRAKQELMEKLKKLGGPPSDVYYPYWPGFVMHPAFMVKEDWINRALRRVGNDPNILERERQAYFEAQQRWQQEQEEIAKFLQDHPQLLSKPLDVSVPPPLPAQAASSTSEPLHNIRYPSNSPPSDFDGHQVALHRAAAFAAAAAANASTQQLSSSPPNVDTLLRPPPQQPFFPMAEGDPHGNPNECPQQ